MRQRARWTAQGWVRARVRFTFRVRVRVKVRVRGSNACEDVRLGAGRVARRVGVRLDRGVAQAAAEQAIGEERGLHP